MALTSSKMIALNTAAPDFELLDVISGRNLSLKDLKSDKATVVMFIRNHCPFVQHIYKELVKVAHDYKVQGISFVGISANDPVEYPEDAPDHMKKVAESLGFSFPYLFDATQEVAKAYAAACTPDFFVYDANLKCVYRGQFDDSRPNNGLPVTGSDLKAALEAILAGQPVPQPQKPSIGCNIKWRT